MAFSLAVALYASTAFAAEKILHGAFHDLPASAPENQVLLNLKTSKIKDTNCSIGDAIKQNFDVHEQLSRIISTPYFSTYKVDLSDSRCPLEDDSATCSNRQCAIEPLSSKDIDPNLFQSQYLGRLRKDSVSLEAPEGVSGEECTPEHASLYALNNNKDYCYPEDESSDEGVWIDLTGNSERFTGYQGAHAQLMWSKVYAENCFGYHGDKEEDDINHLDKRQEVTGPGGLADIMHHPQGQKPSIELPTEECIEQRLFYRLLSGMHASISTHLTYDWLNTTSNKWQTNMPEWLERVGWHPDRLNNLFFDYALVSRAVSKLINSYEQKLLFSSSCQSVDIDVRSSLKRLGRQLKMSPLATCIDEKQLFATPEGALLKNEFRQRVKNVNALMSCVGCERCRLWGKIQTAGYGTALKILFELPEKHEDDEQAASELLSTFRRSELVALINTFARISRSVYAVEEYLDDAEKQLVDKMSFSYSWNQEMALTKEGLKFILNSYWQFPRNIFEISLYYMHTWWAKFVDHGAPEVTDISDLQDFHNDL